MGPAVPALQPPRRRPFTLLDTTDRTRKYLPYHIALSALALALTLVHLYTAVMYR